MSHKTTWGKVARAILKQWKERPWLPIPSIAKIQELTMRLQATRRSELTPEELRHDEGYRALCVLNGFLFENAIKDLERKSAADALQTGFEIGCLYAAILEKIGEPRSPGAPVKDHWEKARNIFQNKTKSGIRVTGGTLWRDCKTFMESADIERPSFNRTFARKRKEWLKTL